MILSIVSSVLAGLDTLCGGRMHLLTGYKLHIACILTLISYTTMDKADIEHNVHKVHGITYLAWSEMMHWQADIL